MISLFYFPPHTVDAAEPLSTETGSPIFGNRERHDGSQDLIQYDLASSTSKSVFGPGSVDILAVDHQSDGMFLNATIWLMTPFISAPRFGNVENIEYGMYIDSDSNLNTGFNGFDYQSEVQWNNNTQSWSKTFTKWSPYGQQRLLQNITDYNGFFKEGDDGFYVLVSTDLSLMQYPERYKVIFYSGREDGEKILTTDFTPLVDIPIPDVSLSTVPTELTIKQGERKTIEIKVNSTLGYELTTDLVAFSRDKEEIQAEFRPEGNVLTIAVPFSGEVTAPATIVAENNATEGPHTLVISSESRVNYEELNLRLGQNSSNVDSNTSSSGNRMGINDGGDDNNDNNQLLQQVDTDIAQSRQSKSSLQSTSQNNGNDTTTLATEKQSIDSEQARLGLLQSQTFQAEEIQGRTSLLVIVERKLTELEQMGEFMTTWNAPLTFFYGILAGTVPWFFTKLRERIKKSKSPSE